VVMDSGLSSRINLFILDGAHDFRSTFNTGPGRNSRAGPFGARALNRCAIARGGGGGAHRYGTTRGEMVSSVWVILS
jgi:hypothetical protein